MENSLSAFRRAAAEGYSYIETDVHATADEFVVAHHDADLNRTTDGRGAIRRLPFAAVRTARIAGREPICRLDDALEELPDVLFNIDVKADSAVSPVLDVLRKHNAWHRVCLAAFDERRLKALRQDGGPRLLTSMGTQSVRALWTAARFGGRPLRPLVHGDLAQVPPLRGRRRVIDDRFVRRAHCWGLEVHAWTVDTAKEMTDLLQLGVDGLVTDRPDILASVLQQRSDFVSSDTEYED